MDKQRLMDTFIEKNHLRLVRGDKEHSSPLLLPYLMVDGMYCLYFEHIAELNVRHRLKHLKTQWETNYRRFLSKFMCVFSEDELVDLCDIMNDFSDFIHNDVEILRVAIMRQLDKYDLETRKTLSAVIACNHLLQSAQVIWGYNFQDGRGRKDVNDHIRNMEHLSMEFLNEFIKGRRVYSESIALDTLPEVAKASKALCKKMVAFLDKL